MQPAVTSAVISPQCRVSWSTVLHDIGDDGACCASSSTAKHQLATARGRSVSIFAGVRAVGTVCDPVIISLCESIPLCETATFTSCLSRLIPQGGSTSLIGVTHQMSADVTKAKEQSPKMPSRPHGHARHRCNFRLEPPW